MPSDRTLLALVYIYLVTLLWSTNVILWLKKCMYLNLTYYDVKFKYMLLTNVSLYIYRLTLVSK